VRDAPSLVDGEPGAAQQILGETMR
jgi:hypothetical protein